MLNIRFYFFIMISCSFSATAQTVLQPEDMKYDLKFLKTTWEACHPGIYRYNSKQQINTYFQALNNKTNKALPLKTFFVLLSQLNSSIHCGHTFVSFYNNKKVIKEELYSKYFLPIMFRVIEGRFIITYNLSNREDIKPGTEIISIDGIKVQTIIDSLLTVSKADGQNGLNKQLDNITIYPRDINTKRYCLFDIYYPLFFKSEINKDSFNMQIHEGKQIKSVTLKGLTKEEREKTFVERFGEVPKNEESWYFREIDQKTVLFRLGDFATYQWKFDFKKYLDSTFKLINQKGYQNLIVDIRENEGGADEARDAVLSYLTKRPIGCANPVRRLYRYCSLPDSLKPSLDTWDEDFKKDKVGYVLTPDGFYEKQNAGVSCDSIYPKPNHFKGQVYLITDATNSSATFIMADCVKRDKLGLIVGEKTGGTLQGINGGELFFLYLPKSKIEMDLPLIWQRPFSPQSDDGVLPDFDVKTTTKDLALRKDPQLQYILTKLIK